MPTLEMIRLRSAMPNSGLLTLRYPLPPLNPAVIPDLPGVDDLDEDLPVAEIEHGQLEQDSVDDVVLEPTGGDAR